MKFVTKKTLLLASLIILTAGAILTVLLFKQDAPAGDTLAPKEVVSIADTKAVSPCQALTEKDVTSIFGSGGPGSYIDETYYATSLDKEKATQLRSRFPSSVECRYILDDTENSVVSVKFEQFLSEEDAKEDWNSAVSYDKTYATELLQEFEAGIPSAAIYKLDPEQLQAAADSLRSAIDSVDSGQAAQSISSDGTAILYSPNRNGFITLLGNRIVKVGYEFGSNNFFDEERQISKEELPVVVNKVKSTFDAINQNLAKKDISQAPSPTLRGMSDKTTIGNTRILDACEILTDSMAVASMDSPSLSPVVQRKSIQKDINRANPASPYLSNSCLKRSLSSNDEAGYASLELTYTPSASEAKNYVTDSLKKYVSRNQATDIATDAETEKYVEIPSRIVLSQFVRFQHKGYVGTFTISKSDTDDNPVSVNKEKFQTAVNEIIAQLNT